LLAAFDAAVNDILAKEELGVIDTTKAAGQLAQVARDYDCPMDETISSHIDAHGWTGIGKCVKETIAEYL
jgi:hypothetical protein